MMRRGLWGVLVRPTPFPPRCQRLAAHHLPSSSGIPPLLSLAAARPSACARLLPLVRATPALQLRHHGGGGHRHHDHDHNPFAFLKRLWPGRGHLNEKEGGHHHNHHHAAAAAAAIDSAPVSEEEERRRVEERRKEVLESQRLSRVVTWAGLGANVALFLAKAAAAHFGGSEAMLADALHTLSDGLSDGVTLWAIYMSALPHSAAYPYGRGRFETVGTFLVACSLISSGAGIAYHAVEGVLSGEERLVPTELALYGAIGSILVKEILYQVTMVVARRANSSLLKANAWHHRSDAMSSIIALLGIAAAQAGQSPYWDPVAAAVVSAMIVRMGWGMVRQSVGELTDAAKGNEEDVADVRYLALRVPGVRECSAVRVRRLGPYSAGDVRIALADPGASLDEALAIKDKVRSELLHHMPQLREVVIELSSPTQIGRAHV